MPVRMSLGFLPVAGFTSTPGTGQNFGRRTLATTCAFPVAENLTAGVVAARVPLQNTDKARSGTGFLFPGGTTGPAVLAAGAAEATPPSTAQPPRAMAVAPAPAMIIRSRVRITTTSRIRGANQDTPFAPAGLFLIRSAGRA